MYQKKTTPCSMEQLSQDLLELLAIKGYSEETIRNYRGILNLIKQFIQKNSSDESYTVELGKAFLSAYTAYRKLGKERMRLLKTVLHRLDDLYSGTGYQRIHTADDRQIPEVLLPFLKEYLESCTCKGNKPGTIMRKRDFCGQFLVYLEDDCKNLSEITAEQVGRACLRFENRDVYAEVRMFLKYLYDRCFVSHDYSGIVPHYRKLQVLPSVYTAEEVHRLENVVDRSSVAGKRNYAILLIASRLGLRSGDIVSLTFENLDFEAGIIRLTQSKTGQPLTLPLLPEINEALIEYIRTTRPPAVNNYVFLSLSAPHDRISTSAIRHALTGYFYDAGIEIIGKKHGAHSLRASLTSAMVNDGIPYDVVRKVLGHSDPDAVKHYAKIDLVNLRRYALEVPDPSGMFAELLSGRMRI